MLKQKHVFSSFFFPVATSSYFSGTNARGNQLIAERYRQAINKYWIATFQIQVESFLDSACSSSRQSCHTKFMVGVHRDWKIGFINAVKLNMQHAYLEFCLQCYLEPRRQLTDCKSIYFIRKNHNKNMLLLSAYILYKTVSETIL